MMKTVRSTSAGFTLIETLVAITILTLAVVGPLFAAHRAVIAAQISRSQLVASYLAQEGVEYVRSMRDSIYLAASPGADASTVAWTTFLTSNNPLSVTQCRASQGNPNVWCAFDPTLSSGLQPCSGGSCTPLYLSSSGVYVQSSTGAPTPYTRSIQVLDIPGTADGASPYPDKRLVSKVSWAYQGKTYTVTVTDHLTPWQ